ncbi:unnamed protein product [Cylicocyclus nassatus]|uniref:Uncharacterized protein n=1 Tax=Cylicocyclus nassatus TaxID=53992 RepID=A0AA36GWV8_CYLNA|nr:unnamed protein product [Cylicocyclus nassatus]
MLFQKLLLFLLLAFVHGQSEEDVLMKLCPSNVCFRHSQCISDCQKLRGDTGIYNLTVLLRNCDEWCNLCKGYNLKSLQFLSCSGAP